MRIQDSGKQKYVILEENESVSVVATGKKQTTAVSVTNREGRTDVMPNPEAVSIVKPGKEELLNKCDRWFEAFTKVHDMFRNLALSDRCKQMRINMDLAVSAYVNVKRDNDTGKCIDIDLKRYGEMIQEGPSLEIPSENEDIFKYMLARVLEYYLVKNYGNTPVDISDDWNYLLRSPDHVEYEEVFPLKFHMSIIREMPEYDQLVKGIIYKFNLGLPIKPVIEDLKNRIAVPKSIERVNESVDYSERQWNNLNDISGSFLK